MQVGSKVIINNDTFKGLIKFNGKRGNIAAKTKGSPEIAVGKSGNTFAVDFPDSTRLYVKPENLTEV